MRLALEVQAKVQACARQVYISTACFQDLIWWIDDTNTQMANSSRRADCVWGSVQLGVVAPFETLL